jgi:hypothetical protein
MKTCSRCKETKPFELFSKCAGQADGFQRYCKACQKEKKTIWDKENYAHICEYNKEWQKKNPERHKAAVRKQFLKMVAKYPEKRVARSAVSNALRDKRLEKEPCWVCGTKKSEAHHVSYSDPLLVSWLCFEHHREAHALLKAA